jgi:hypothetical protein
MDNSDIQRSFYGETSSAAQDVFPMFIREPVKNEMKSAEQGRPIYETIEMIHIIIPGDNKTAPVRRVTDHDRERFAAAYQRFKNEEEMVFDGTPVDAWPRLTTREVYSLKAQNFFTVESIANCPDANLSKLGMGGMMLRDLAKAYIDAAAKGGNAEKLVIENAQLKTQIGEMAKTIQGLTDKFEAFIKKSGGDVTAAGVDLALSNTRAVVEKKAALPEGWESKTFKELASICAGLEFAAAPRSREEAVKLLSEYEATRKAVRAAA